MTSRIAELKNLAEEAKPALERYHSRGRIADDNAKLNVFGRAANPQTILAMIECIEKMKAQIEKAIRSGSLGLEALAALEQFDGGGE